MSIVREFEADRFLRKATFFVVVSARVASRSRVSFHVFCPPVWRPAQLICSRAFVMVLRHFRESDVFCG